MHLPTATRGQCQVSGSRKNSQPDAGALMNHPNAPVINPNANVHSLEEWNSLNTTMTELIVSDYCGNCRELDSVNLSAFEPLKRVEIGNHCFKYTRKTIVAGLNELESVVIGNDCFIRVDDLEGFDRHVVFKDCPRLREVKIGFRSFYSSRMLCDYTSPVSEMTEVDSVETVSEHFRYTEEKGIVYRLLLRIDESRIKERYRDLMESDEYCRVMFDSYSFLFE